MHPCMQRFDWCMIGNNPLASMVGLRELHIHARKPLVNAQEMVSCISSLTALRHLSFHGPERDPLTIKHNDRPNVQHAVAITEAISSLTQVRRCFAMSCICAVTHPDPLLLCTARRARHHCAVRFQGAAL